MEKCSFLSVKFIPGKRGSQTAKSPKSPKAKFPKANTQKAKFPEANDQKANTTKPNQVFLTIKKADGKICRFEVANKVCKYFGKPYASKSLVDALGKKARIGQVTFLLDNGMLVIE